MESERANARAQLHDIAVTTNAVMFHQKMKREQEEAKKKRANESVDTVMQKAAGGDMDCQYKAGLLFCFGREGVIKRRCLHQLSVPFYLLFRPFIILSIFNALIKQVSQQT